MTMSRAIMVLLVGGAALAAGGTARAQYQPGGAPAGGGSIGTFPDQRSGDFPAAGDSSAGNTMSPRGTLGMGQAVPPSMMGGGGRADSTVGPGASPAPRAPATVSPNAGSGQAK